MKHIIVLLFGCILSTFTTFAKVDEYTITVVKEYPHDRQSYTQGLFFRGTVLCESTGQYGESSYLELDIETGKAVREVKFSSKYFCEGSCVLDGTLYILTWTNKIAFTYDPETLKFKQGYSYPREGWGLTTDGKRLIASDGTSRLYFMDGKFSVLKSVNVTMNGRPVRYLNELEWIDGKVWANVYTTDMIVIIDPETGVVEGTIDCTGLLPNKLRRPGTDVLNGIAYNPLNGNIYLTGKNWPKLYQVILKKLNY